MTIVFVPVNGFMKNMDMKFILFQKKTGLRICPINNSFDF